MNTELLEALNVLEKEKSNRRKNQCRIKQKERLTTRRWHGALR